MIEQLRKELKAKLYNQSIEDIDFKKLSVSTANRIKNKDLELCIIIPAHPSITLSIASSLIFNELYDLCDAYCSDNEAFYLKKDGFDEDQEFIVNLKSSLGLCSYFLFKRSKCQRCDKILYNAPIMQEWCEECEAHFEEEKKYEWGYNPVARKL